MRKFAVLVCLAVLCVSSTPAQSFAARVLGTVKDTSDSVVPNAQVVMVNTATNARAEVRSDAGGNYVAAQLTPGQYRIEVEAAGFKKFLREGLTLAVDQQARVDIVLSVGAVTESVIVTANAPLLEATTSSVGKVVDNKRIMALPLNTRNVYSLVFLTPGVTGSVGNNYNSLSYNVNGARGGFDTIIDGVTASHPTVNGAAGITVFPSVDAIEEFKLMGANYSAEFGRSMGSVLNVVFKSGGNQFHGSAYEFLRNSVLDANNFFSRGRGVELPNLKRSQFGGMASGPIKRDKTFFMVSYEGLRQKGFSSTTTSVPTLPERAGDFSQSLAANAQVIRIFDPFSTRANPAGGFIRDQFPNNIIPAARLDPVAANVLKYYPLPNTPGVVPTNRNNYYRTGASSLNTDNWDFRVDHNLTSTQKVFARYSHRNTANVPSIFWPQDIAIADGRQNEDNHAKNAVAEYSNTLSPTTILTARLGFARTLYVLDNQGLGFLPSALGLPSTIDAAVDRQMFPRFNAGGYASLG
ncbi:MAG: carboxypeptidase regulatory-like domain-containing protein, partial [Bryobacteraceae bacterium]